MYQQGGLKYVFQHVTCSGNLFCLLAARNVAFGDNVGAPGSLAYCNRTNRSIMPAVQAVGETQNSSQAIGEMLVPEDRAA